MRLHRARFDWCQSRKTRSGCQTRRPPLIGPLIRHGLRKAHNSVGAIIEVTARGMVPGLGDRLCKVRHGFGGGDDVDQRGQGVEIGEGMGAAMLTGVENADEIRMGANGPEFLTNHAGGILGGISTGQDVVVRFSVKPTSSILTPRQSVTMAGEEVDLITKVAA